MALLWAAACGSGDTSDEETCGPNGTCPAGFVCNPVNNRCIRMTGGGPDASLVVDAAAPVIDASLADADPLGPCVSLAASGNTFYFSRARVMGAANGTSWKIGMGVATVEPLLDGARPVGVPGTPARVLYENGDADGSRGDLYIRDLAAQQSTLLFDSSDYLVGFDVTGESPPRVIFDYLCGQKVKNLDGTGQMDLMASGSCYFDGPAVRKSDNKLAFHAADPSGPAVQGLFVSDSTGLNRVKVAGTQAGDYWPVWSPSGESIAFLRTGSASGTRGPIMILAPDGTGLRTVAAATGTDGFEGRVAFTADGSLIVAAGRVNGVPGLWVMAQDGSSAPSRVCTPDGPEINWVSRAP